MVSWLHAQNKLGSTISVSWVATAQGKQKIWKSIFTDRVTGNLPKNIEKIFLHQHKENVELKKN